MTAKIERAVAALQTAVEEALAEAEARGEDRGRRSVLSELAKLSGVTEPKKRGRKPREK
jgi:hypothetical protein